MSGRIVLLTSKKLCLRQPFSNTFENLCGIAGKLSLSHIVNLASCNEDPLL